METIKAVFVLHVGKTEWQMVFGARSKHTALTLEQVRQDYRSITAITELCGLGGLNERGLTRLAELELLL